MKLGKFSLVYSLIDTLALFKEVADLFEIQLSLRTQVKFVLEVDPNIPKLFRTDQ